MCFELFLLDWTEGEVCKLPGFCLQMDCSQTRVGHTSLSVSAPPKVTPRCPGPSPSELTVKAAFHRDTGCQPRLQAGMGVGRRDPPILSIFLAGKWHQGLSCASRNDHCHHPLNHGFDHFYGMPLGLLSDCQTSGRPELHRGLRVRLWVSTAALGLLPLLLLLPRLAGRLAVPWTAIVPFALLALLFFVAWFSSYGFVRRWNCVLMRDHEIVQQPVRVERISALLLNEALGFIERYRVLPGPAVRVGSVCWVRLGGLQSCLLAAEGCRSVGGFLPSTHEAPASTPSTKDKIKLN